MKQKQILFKNEASHNQKFSQGAAVLFLYSAMVVCAAEPTEFEQYMLELINRARQNPEAEVLRLSTGSLNEGPPTLGGESWKIVSGARQPIAFNPLLIKAARDYATLLNDNDVFRRTYGGMDSKSRMITAGYTPGPYQPRKYGSTADYGGSGYVPGPENLSRARELPSNGYTNSELKTQIDNAHKSMFNDFSTASRVHRSTMMYGQWREIGIGVSIGTDIINSKRWDSIYIAYDVAAQAGNPFLTGVVYNDIVDDDFYTPASNEALGGWKVEAFVAGTNTSAGSTTTFASGGYSLQLPTGTYDVFLSGPNPAFQKITNVDFTGGENVKLDFINPSSPTLINYDPESKIYLGLQNNDMALTSAKLIQSFGRTHF
jgi:uncharacterized protein YkwD